MKKMKRFFATLVAVMLMASMLAVPASAETGTYSIKISNAAGHTFSAYQIFKGTLSGTVLSDVEWADGVNPSALMTALKSDSTIKSFFETIPTETPEQLAAAAAAVALSMENPAWAEDPHTIAFAKVVSGCVDSTKAHTGSMVDGNYVIGNLAPGYYFVQDTTDNLTNDAYSRYMIQLTKDTPVAIKKDAPTLNKFVSTGLGIGTLKAISAGPGNTVYFTLTAKMHSRIADFATYPLTITDTLPAGLAFGQLEQVYVNSTLVADIDTTNSIPQIADTTSLGQTIAGQNVTFTVADAKDFIADATHGATVVSTDSISLVFSATVNTADKLVIGGSGNQNSAVMSYPNNPNIASSPTSNTSASTATVYSYELKLTKKDSAHETITLNGAEFNIYFLDDAGNKKFILANGVDENSDTIIDYYDITDVITVGKDDPIPEIATEFITANDGTFTVKGLREREYFLHEHKAPTNYNKIKTDQTVTILAGFSGESLGTLTATPTGTFTTVGTPNATTGTVFVTVTNNQGTTLPQTGGMGTTIFYVAGAILMIGAGAVLATKKRTQK